jgi:putative RecB family exonuclease
VAASLVFGSSFHSALEFHFRELLMGNAAPSLDTLLDVFWQEWESRGSAEITFPRGEGLTSFAGLAERMLRAFRASNLALPSGTIIGVEEELRGELVPGLPDVLARVDLMVDSGDALIVTDFKTARTAWSAHQVDDWGGQLLMYHELARPLADGRPLKLVFVVFTKTRIPLVTLHPVKVDDHQLERTRRVVETVWRAIEGEHFYPAPSPLNCPGCPFRDACRAWRG